MFIFLLLSLVVCDYSIHQDTIIYQSDGIHSDKLPNYNGFQLIDTIKFNLAMQNAISNPNITKFLLKKDFYYVPMSKANFWIPCKQNTKPLLFDFQESTIIFKNKAKTGIAMDACFNTTLQNVIIKWDINSLAFTQGTVVAIASDNKHANVSTHAGYSGMLDAGICGIMDPIKHEFNQKAYFGVKKITQMNSNLFRFDMTNLAIRLKLNQNMNVGDYLSCRTEGGAHAITNNGGGYNKLINIQISNGEL